MCLRLPFTPDTHLAVHQDVKANPKHLEEVPVVGPILHEVPGKPWGRGKVTGMMEKRLGWRVPRASWMQEPLEVYKEVPCPPVLYRRGIVGRNPSLIPGMLYSTITLTPDIGNFPSQSWPGGPQGNGEPGVGLRPLSFCSLLGQSQEDGSFPGSSAPLLGTPA